ncbi:MAG: hypothetical protein IK025_06230 [Bacteroidales bacterium]|nr:hypothetical protein [Bacteroidales bacterium]
MKKLVAILLLVCAVNMAYPQFIDNTLIKTRPMKFLFNPNLSFEKPFHKYFSATAEIAYRRRELFSDGSIDGQYFNKSTTILGEPSKVKFNGVEFDLGLRAYLVTVQTPYLEGYYWNAPLGLYLETIVGYIHSAVWDLQIYDYEKSVYNGVNCPYYRADVRLDKLSLFFLLGYQFNIENVFSLDINLGARYYCVAMDSRKVVSATPTGDGIYPGKLLRENNPCWHFAGRVTIGYYIRCDWME